MRCVSERTRKAAARIVPSMILRVGTLSARWRGRQDCVGAFSGLPWSLIPIVEDQTNPARDPDWILLRPRRFPSRPARRPPAQGFPWSHGPPEQSANRRLVNPPLTRHPRDRWSARSHRELESNPDLDRTVASFDPRQALNSWREHGWSGVVWVARGDTMRDTASTSDPVHRSQGA
jgi:hypothetical protein